MESVGITVEFEYGIRNLCCTPTSVCVNLDPGPPLCASFHLCLEKRRPYIVLNAAGIFSGMSCAGMLALPWLHKAKGCSGD